MHVVFCTVMLWCFCWTMRVCASDHARLHAQYLKVLRIRCFVYAVLGSSSHAILLPNCQAKRISKIKSKAYRKVHKKAAKVRKLS